MRVVIIYILYFAVMDALNSCNWCGRVKGEVKSYEEAGSCFGVLMDRHLWWLLVGEKGEVRVGYQFGGGYVWTRWGVR